MADKKEHDSLEPRNARLKDMDEVDREAEGRRKSMDKKIDAFRKGEIPEEEYCEESEAKKDAKSLKDFIEIVIRLPKS